MANCRNKLFAIKSRRRQRSQKLPTHYVNNNYVPDPNGNNSQKNFYNLEEQDLLPAKQKGVSPGNKGCKDQLNILKAIYEDCKWRNGNLSVSCTDYQKIFDSVPLNWVEKSIKIVGITTLLKFESTTLLK
jgi:hypothetical protein